jgi:hypothetical protein
MSSNRDDLAKTELIEKRTNQLTWPALIFAVLQSICTALIAASGVQFAVGLSGLITAIVMSSPAQAFHRDVIRLPMLLFAVASAGVNLLLVFQARRLRNRPSAQWRSRPLTSSKRRVEGRQIIISIVTLVLVVLELMAHKHLHGVYLTWLDIHQSAF